MFETGQAMNTSIKQSASLTCNCMAVYIRKERDRFGGKIKMKENKKKPMLFCI